MIEDLIPKLFHLYIPRGIGCQWRPTKNIQTVLILVQEGPNRAAADDNEYY
jgi:hypothetical protein